MRRLIFLALLLPSLAVAQTPADKKAAVSKLLDQLRTAPDEYVAANLETRIQQAWVMGGTPAVNLLMSRGLRQLNAKASADAIAAFSDALVLDPDLAEAWHRRGVARWLNGDLVGATRDLEQTLKLESRHFGAWRTLEQIAEAQSDWKAAYEAWRHVLDIDPRTPKGDDRLKELRRKAFGAPM